MHLEQSATEQSDRVETLERASIVSANVNLPGLLQYFGRME